MPYLPMERRADMSRYWLASVSAFVLATGTALAQGLAPGTTTSTQTTTTAPAIGAYSSSKTERTVGSNGTVIEQTQTYRSGIGGTDATTTTRTIAPDGSQQNSWHQEWTGAPP